jgi:23S rRNA (guanosine2251-2'-O)-methyltransferase
MQPIPPRRRASSSTRSVGQPMPRRHEHAPGRRAPLKSPEGRLIVGMQPVREAIRALGHRLRELHLEGAPGRSSRIDALARFATDQGVRSVAFQARSELDRLARGVVHQGAVAFAPELQLLDPEGLDPTRDFFALALDRIQDPQNFGAIVRSAVALGPATIVWPESSAAPLTPATFRASAGAIEHARLCRVPSLPTWLSARAASGAQVVGLDARGEVELDELELEGSLVLVVGSEHRGLARPVTQVCTVLARLRQPGPIASVNASVAAAIALYIASKKLSNSNR